MIDDDELKKLFDDDDDDQGENSSSSEISAPENSESSVEKKDKKVYKPKAEKPVKKEEKPKDKQPEKNTEKKVEKKAENKVEKKTEKPVVKHEEKKAEMPKKFQPEKPKAKPKNTVPFSVKAKRFFEDAKNKIQKAIKERKENASDVPLKEREYLPKFPINFKGTLLILLAVAIIELALGILFLPFFRVRTVVVEGNIVLSEERLLSDAGIKYGSHLFSGIGGNPLDIIRMDYGKTEKRMMAEDPYIKDIRITVKFPSTIKITVKERNKVAYIKMPDGYAAIDDEGTIIELATLDKDDLSHAVICGLDVSGAVLGEKIDIKDDSDYNKALVILGAIISADQSGVQGEYMLFENVREIRIIPGGNTFLTVILPSGSELQVKLKDMDTIIENMSWLRYAVISDAFEGFPDGALDMTGERIIYRKYE